MTMRFLRALALSLLVPAALAAQSPTVVIVVRHAEKGTTPANDPPLTEAGTARAKALATTLADANVQVVITTQFARTKDTGRPTAEAKGATMEVVAAGGAVPAHAKAVAEAVRKHAGKTILVVGHSNTVSQIVEALGGPPAKDLCDSEYSSIWTVVVDGKTVRVVRSTFGAASPEVATGCPTMR
jgi:phosphohistidine phosphatase SixA